MASSAYERRNERARELGYKSYYDYRIHDHGRIPAGRPAPTGVLRDVLRGHGEGRRAADLLRAIRSGRIDSAYPLVANRDPKTGRMQRVDVLLVDEHGDEELFSLTGKDLDEPTLRAIHDQLVAAGIPFQPGYGIEPAGNVEADAEAA